MAKEAATALDILKPSQRAQERGRRRHNPVIAMLPLRWRFYRSGLYISPLAPLALGFVSGMLTVLLGVGGGFIMVPAMIYLLGMSAQVVVGTSLLQILFVTAVTTIVHATTTRSVDIVLAGLLLIGSVIGAQYGARLAQKMKPELLRMILAIVVLGVAFRIGAAARLAARGNLHGAAAVSGRRIILLGLLAPCSWPGPAPLRPGPATPRARRVAASRSRSATASPAPSCSCSARSSIRRAGAGQSGPTSRSW